MILKNKDFSKISIRFFKKITSIIGTIFLLVFLFICFEVYIPINPSSNETIIFTVEKGWGDTDIADNLEKVGIIRSSYFFKFYAILSLKHSSLQAGEYNISPKMSAHDIANKMAKGDVVRDLVVVPEGWDKNDIGKYLETKGTCTQKYFVSLLKDFSAQGGPASGWDFLMDKPKDADLEGYLFPDTYEVAKGSTCEDILSAMLSNFGQKLTPALRSEIKKQNTSIFDMITMASMIEKEVIGLEDKKIVSGILWKRIIIGMPLQIDATVVYITGNPKVSTNDTKIDSPYNTYKYYGLPKGPISNPGIESITAAIYPTASKYLYYLTAGKTIFSETLEQHNEAKYKYLNN